MTKEFKWPKMPNRRVMFDKGYTSMQMRQYAKKCIEEVLRNKEIADKQEKVEEKNCGQ